MKENMLRKQAERAQGYIDKSLNLLDLGFTSKARQKDANNYLNRAYNEFRDIIHALACTLANEAYPNRENQEAWFEKVDQYSLPFDLHNVRDKHIQLSRELRQDIADRISFLVETRLAIKAEPIQYVESKTQSQYQTKAELAIRELIEKRHAKYLKAVDLGRIFEGLPVSANTHIVVNMHGTEFYRSYYYLNGELTPLNVIVAAAEQLYREACEAH